MECRLLQIKMLWTGKKWVVRTNKAMGIDDNTRNENKWKICYFHWNRCKTHTKRASGKTIANFHFIPFPIFHTWKWISTEESIYLRTFWYFANGQLMLVKTPSYCANELRPRILEVAFDSLLLLSVCFQRKKKKMLTVVCRMNYSHFVANVVELWQGLRLKNVFIFKSSKSKQSKIVIEFFRLNECKAAIGFDLFSPKRLFHFTVGTSHFRPPIHFLPPPYTPSLWLWCIAAGANVVTVRRRLGAYHCFTVCHTCQTIFMLHRILLEWHISTIECESSAFSLAMLCILYVTHAIRFKIRILRSAHWVPKWRRMWKLH